MLVYRDQRSRDDPRHAFSELRSLTHRSPGAPSHDTARDALIASGRLEAAVADSVFPQADGVHPLVQALRAASEIAGHLLWHTWHHNADGAAAWWNRLARQLDSIDAGGLPAEVEFSVPEGYVHYAVYPEMYLEAARRCVAELGRIEAVCLGLRSIGTSLSAAVAAALKELGCETRSATVRPRGDPYSRRTIISDELAALLRPAEATYYLIVDEGPGISGSSMAGVADLLRSWGVADEKILLFPSWETGGTHLRSPLARAVWRRHRQFTAAFEDAWLRSGRFEAAFPGELQDVSAGEWRRVVYDSPADYPAVHPQHERRKYLLFQQNAPGPSRLVSFAGFGDYGRSKLRRAQRLAAAGFTPEPEMLAHGFLRRRFVAGSPVGPGEVTAELLETVAAYLAHLYREHAAEPSVSSDTLREMIATNLEEGLGQSWSKDLLDLPSGEWIERGVMLDGRMLAHEWIRSATGYIKVDALDHHNDHFFPGCQDIAWDLAAAAVELNLGNHGRDVLVEHYRSISGDRGIAQRLPFYRIAYLSFRLGYTSLASATLGDSPDARRFVVETRRYIELIERELGSRLVGHRHG
ncbi:MAG: hypothetical protein ACJ8AP_16420 [Gemmatimonadales bacterium]